MRHTLMRLGVCSVLLLSMAGLARVHASSWDKLTYFTFSGPIQIPDATLGAGTYQFRLANPDSGRNIAMVTSQNGRTVYSSFFVTNLYRDHVTGKPEIVFRETPAGEPKAIKGWFYPGEHTGYEFLYPHRPQ
jgi:hypothetical protein